MMFLVAVIVVFWTTGVRQGFGNAITLALAEESFEQGVKARGTPEETKFFQSAADLYEELRRCGVHNAALYRNQGNALLLAGDLPGAILAYRHGLRLDPNERQMRASLAYVREQVVYSSADTFARPAAGLWPPWMPRVSARTTFWIFGAFYTLTWVGLAWSWTRPTESRRTLVCSGLAGSVFFGAFFAIQVHEFRLDAEHPLVVIAEDKTYLLKGNNALYPRAYETPLNRGVEARLIQARGSWLQIDLSSGQIGWVPRQKALLDVP